MRRHIDRGTVLAFIALLLTIAMSVWFVSLRYGWLAL